MSIFKDCKRAIKQFFEINYWYCFRRLPYLYFDERKKKYVKSKDRAFHVSRDTWEGTRDILDEALLKIDHMYYNLKKYGVESNWYILGAYLDECNKKERDILLQQALDDTADYGKAKCTDHRKTSKEDRKLKRVEVPMWCGVRCTDDTGSNKWMLQAFIQDYYDKKYSKIIDTKVRFVVKNYDFNKDKSQQIEIKTTEYDFKDRTLSRFLEILKDLNPKIIEKTGMDFGLDKKDSAYKMLMKAFDTDTINITPKIYCQLSDKIKKKCQGNRKKLHDLLLLRKDIRKLSIIWDTDDKYSSTWFGKNFEDKEAERKAILDGHALYDKDVKDLYMKIANFMAENHDYWWD